MAIFSRKKDVEPVAPVVAPKVAPKPKAPKKVEQAHEHAILDSVEQANKDRNEALVGDGPSGGVPSGTPVLPGPTKSYLGNDL